MTKSWKNLHDDLAPKFQMGMHEKRKAKANLESSVAKYFGKWKVPEILQKISVIF